MSEARITPSLIFHGGRILTAEDAGTTSPGAVAVLDNRIVAVHIDYSKKTAFTRGAVRTNFDRFPLTEKLRFLTRAAVRHVVG